MASKILLIDHHDNLRDDRVSVYLGGIGFETELCCPFKGDRIPEINGSLAGAVVYGGAQNVTDIDQFPFLEEEIAWINSAVENEFPLVGICLGAQLIAHTLGAHVDNHESNLCEFGYYEIEPAIGADHWFTRTMLVTQAHYQQFDLPEYAVLLAKSGNFGLRTS